MRLHPEAFTPRDDSTTTAVLAKRQAKPKKAQKGKPKAAKPVKPTPSAKKVLTEDECKSYAKECKSTYQDTFVAWSFLADIELAAMRVPLVDRFNMSEAFMAELTGAAPEQTVRRAIAMCSPM